MDEVALLRSERCHNKQRYCMMLWAVLALEMGCRAGKEPVNGKDTDPWHVESEGDDWQRMAQLVSLSTGAIGAIGVLCIVTADKCYWQCLVYCWRLQGGCW